MIEQVQETKLFSQHTEDQAWLNSLRASSVSDADALNRMSEYKKLFSRYESMKEAYKTVAFSGVTELPLLSNQYFNATVASFVRSFAGYLSIERDMAEPTALLWYDDVLGVADERTVLANIGEENLNGLQADIIFNNVTIPAGGLDLAAGKVIVPGSLQGSFTSADGTQTVKFADDANGNILAPAGVLATGSVNYKTGAIKATLAGATFTGGTYSLKAAADEPGTPTYGTLANNQTNRVKLDMKNIIVKSIADMLIGDSNLVAMAQANKSLGQNPMQGLGAKLVELYTKVVNLKLVNATKAAAKGNDYVIDASGWATTFYDYNSRLNAFSAELVNVDTDLAEQSVKGVEATAYLVSPEAGNWFRKLRATGEFVEEKGSTYVNDLLGTYNGIPVLRHVGVESGYFYAIHKTADGALAPVMCGQYLPLTWTPAIGNYNNSSQISQGVFYQMGVEPIASALIKRVKIQEA
jgi:hypothetical protein